MSLTTFAAGDRRARAVPDPALVVKSWASSWNGANASGAACPPGAVDDLARHLEPIDGSLTWGVAQFRHDPDRGAATVHAPFRVYGFVGSLTLRLHRNALPDSRLWLGRLAWLAGYAGTGYHPQIGLGATVASPRRPSADPSGTPKRPSSADAP